MAALLTAKTPRESLILINDNAADTFWQSFWLLFNIAINGITAFSD
jgi:hypothetical protein